MEVHVSTYLASNYTSVGVGTIVTVFDRKRNSMPVWGSVRRHRAVEDNALQMAAAVVISKWDEFNKRAAEFDRKAFDWAMPKTESWLAGRRKNPVQLHMEQRALTAAGVILAPSTTTTFWDEIKESWKHQKSTWKSRKDWWAGKLNNR